MGLITGPSFLSFNDLYTSDTTIPSGYSLGQLAYGSNGELYRYALVGGTALVTGYLYQSKPIDTQFTDLAVPATQTKVTNGGVQYVTITNGTTVVAANDFVGGTISVAVAPDLGATYRVVGHTTDSVGSAALTLVLDRPLLNNWSTATKVTLKPNPWSGLVIKDYDAFGEAPVVGAAIFPVVAGQYGWVQTRGEATVISDGSTFACGDTVGASTAIDGCVGVDVAGTAHQKVGFAFEADQTGKGIKIFLQID